MYIKSLFRHWTYKLFAPGTLLREKYEAFRKLLEYDKRSHELIAELQEIHYDGRKVDFTAVEAKCNELSSNVSNVAACLTKLCTRRYINLPAYLKKIDFYIQLALSGSEQSFSPPFVIDLNAITADMHTLVGGKALNLAVARNALGLPAPEGFVITSNAFNYFIEANNLRAEINARLATVDIQSMASLERVSRELTDIIWEAPVPEPVEAEITKAFRALRERISSSSLLEPAFVSPGVEGPTCRVPSPQVGGESLRITSAPRFSVRSSAVGEDGRSSYAGQYTTVLNVPESDAIAAYKNVIASKYSAHAILYRIFRGDIDQETPMAVMVLQMIDAKAGGIVYTRDPADPDNDAMVIYTVWGLGKALVDGIVTPDVIKIPRSKPQAVERQDSVAQQAEAVLSPEGGITMIHREDSSPASLALTDESATNLAEWALRLESYHCLPQDVEWSMDYQNRLFVLQSRPLSMENHDEKIADCSDLKVDNPVLLSGGIRACGGIAIGAVYNAEQENGLQAIPEGAVLVTRSSAPEYAAAMGRIGALVTDRGSAAGHLATVARELQIPALVNTGSATNVLATGRIVTVDADSGKVYEGSVQAREEPGKHCGRTSRIAVSPLTGKLQETLKYIVPLSLTDPQADNFKPEGCKTFHDIIRFSHEKAVEEMFSLGERGSRSARGAKRLRSRIPIVTYLLDLGGGIDAGCSDKKDVHPEAIRSAPFRALWKGLNHPGIHWDADVIHFDWKEFDRLSHGIVQPDSALLGSYAVLSSDYLNFHIHFGYHFVVVDTLCTVRPEDNYLILRFAGGGGRTTSRFLRIRFLEEILFHFGFKVEKRGDLIDAHMGRHDAEKIENTLEMVGILLGSSRVLDMALENSSQVYEMVERFLQGDYNLSPLSRR
jgi:pyruvate,water dikinase